MHVDGVQSTEDRAVVTIGEENDRIFVEPAASTPKHRGWPGKRDFERPVGGCRGTTDYRGW